MKGVPWLGCSSIPGWRELPELSNCEVVAPTDEEEGLDVVGVSLSKLCSSWLGGVMVFDGVVDVFSRILRPGCPSLSIDDSTWCCWGTGGRGAFPGVPWMRKDLPDLVLDACWTFLAALDRGWPEVSRSLSSSLLLLVFLGFSMGFVGENGERKKTRREIIWVVFSRGFAPN
jgi:hypothetical protein